MSTSAAGGQDLGRYPIIPRPRHIEARDGEQVRHAVNVVRNRFGDEGTADYLVGEYHFSRQDWGPARKALESSFGKNPNATVAQRLALTTTQGATHLPIHSFVQTIAH